MKKQSILAILIAALLVLTIFTGCAASSKMAAADTASAPNGYYDSKQEAAAAETPMEAPAEPEEEFAYDTIVNRWAYYTVRIPCEQFEAFLHETEGFGNVISTSRDAQNVTSAYTDYEARLSSLNTQEERLLDMLSKSEDVETLIALEQRLSDVRYEIESIERSLRNYDMQIKYSTVDLDLREVEVYTPTVPVRRTFSQKLSDSLSDGWTGFTRGVQNIILGLASALPALILLAVIVIVVIVLVKNARKKRRAKFAAQQEPPQEPKQ